MSTTNPTSPDRAQTQVAAVRSQRLTAWAMARPLASWFTSSCPFHCPFRQHFMNPALFLVVLWAIVLTCQVGCYAGSSWPLPTLATGAVPGHRYHRTLHWTRIREGPSSNLGRNMRHPAWKFSLSSAVRPGWNIWSTCIALWLLPFKSFPIQLSSLILHHVCWILTAEDNLTCLIGLIFFYLIAQK
jgi:hypothetical protein